MAEIVNLRQARKQRTRRDKERKAEDNRVQFGRTKAEKTLTRTQKTLDADRHKAGKLDQEDN